MKGCFALTETVLKSYLKSLNKSSNNNISKLVYLNSLIKTESIISIIRKLKYST